MLRGLIIALISLFFCTNISFAESFDLASGIEQYKSGNYEECIKTMKNVVKDDPAMVLGYYYLGLAYTKTGKEILAVDYYNKVINLNSDPTITMLAREGKSKIKANVSSIEEQLEDIEDDIKDNPIYNDGAKLSPEELRVKYEAPKKESEGMVIKASDYAKGTQNQNPQAQNQNAQPSNDDIVNAIKTLQKAGILNNGITPMQAGVMPMPMDSKTQQMNAMLMMMNGNNNNNNGMMNMMPYMNNGGKVDPQMLQMMMMQQMMPNFSAPQNNNGY